MLRILLLAVALLLPVQFAWAGMTESCQHESDPAMAQHIGHCEHQHQGGKSPVDDNCGACHGHVVSLPAANLAAPADAAASVRLLPQDAVRLAAAPSRAPDRPQWSRLA